MFREYVLIIRRSKLHYTASGIITPIGGRLVHRLREDCSPHVIVDFVVFPPGRGRSVTEF